MKPKNTLLGVAIFYCLSLGAQNIDYVLHFEKGSHELLATEKQNLENWALSHYHVRHEPLLLRGHTDEDADSKSNIELSKRRNQSVHTLLTMNGFDNISYKFYGEDWPICNEKDEKCMSINRRVEVLLLEEENEKWAQNTLLESPQVKFIKSSENNIVKGEQGTKLIVPQNAFFNADGTEAENIRIELKEFYEVGNCLKQNISTMCGDKILESGGMIEINAFNSEGEELILDPANAPKISFKDKAENTEGMQLFYGKIEDGVMKWTEEPEIKERSTNAIKTECSFFYASQGNIVVHFDQKLGWLNILVTKENRDALNKIRKKTATQITKEDRDKLSKWDQQTRNIEERNREELAEMRRKKNRQDSIAEVKMLEKLTKAEKKQYFESKKTESEFNDLNGSLNNTFRIKGTGFINCDRYINSSKSTTFDFVCSDSDKVNYYILVKSINSIIVLSSSSKFGSVCKASTILDVGIDIDVIAVGKKDNELSICKKNIVTSLSNNEIMLELEPASKEKIDEILGSYRMNV